MSRATTWWVIAWLLLAVGQRVLGCGPGPSSRAVRLTGEKLRAGVCFVWKSESGVCYQCQTSDDRAAWTDVGAPREGTGGTDSVRVHHGGPRYYRLVRVDSAAKGVTERLWLQRLFQPRPVLRCGGVRRGRNIYLKESPKWLLDSKPQANRLPGRVPGLHRLGPVNRPVRLQRANEVRLQRARQSFPGHKEGNGNV